jgi:hypothetical protein
MIYTDNGIMQSDCAVDSYRGKNEIILNIYWDGNACEQKKLETRYVLTETLV